MCIFAKIDIFCFSNVDLIIAFKLKNTLLLMCTTTGRSKWLFYITIKELERSIYVWLQYYQPTKVHFRNVIFMRGYDTLNFQLITECIYIKITHKTVCHICRLFLEWIKFERNVCHFISIKCTFMWAICWFSRNQH